MKTDGQVLSGGFVAQTVALTISSNLVATDFTTANNFTIAANANFTLSNPTGGTSGADMQVLIWRITQDGTGSRLLTLDTRFVLGTDITSATLSTAINKVDYLAARYRYVDGGSGDRFDVVAFIRGYT